MAGIEVSRDGSVLILTIANEAKRNALTHVMSVELARRLGEADNDTSLKCVVITGKGDVAFCSGHDLKEMLADREHASDPGLNAPLVMPAAVSIPTIAAINGHALAGGFILALSCDLRVCAENATFAAPGARLGLLPIGGQLSRLPLLMPRGIAHELLVTCRQMHADEAYRYGFANRLVARGEALSEALGLAELITHNSRNVVREIKRGLLTLETAGVEAATQFEWTTARRLQGEPDAVEGIHAFLEKRAPRFG